MKTKIVINDLTYLPVEDVAIRNDINVNTLKSYYSKKNIYGNDERFKKIDGRLYVLENYKYPLYDKVYDLYLKALIVAKSQNNLAKQLSEIGNIKKTTIEKYFYRFTIKQIKQAKLMIKLLTIYINENSLIPLEELDYSY